MSTSNVLFTRLPRKEAVLTGWEVYVAGRDTFKSKQNGKIAEDIFVLRMGGSAVSQVAFRQVFPDTNIRWIDESNRGAGSVANGPGAIAIDGILPNPRSLGGGISFQMKKMGRRTKGEVVLNVGNFPMIAALLGCYRGHLPAHRCRLPLALVQADMPKVGGDPHQTRLTAFAVIELTDLVALNGRYAGVEYPDYQWDTAAGVHVRDPLKKGRGLAAKAPLRVTWGKGNGGKQTYARLVLSLRHPEVRKIIRWVDTSEFSNEEAADMLAEEIRYVGKR